MQTILIVERQPHLRQLLELECSDAGYKCIGAADGEEAIDALIVEKVDAVILGLGWPPRNDLETMCWIKKWYPQTPVVLFAGIEDLDAADIVRMADVWVEKCSHVDWLIDELDHLPDLPLAHSN